jgi:two-component system, NarL family, invasion response regulator UvrY
MIRVLIADDHAVVRQGLKQIISTTKDIKVTAEAANGQEVLDRIWKENFDVIVLDIKMPGRDGVDVLKQIKTHKPKLPVLVFSMHPEEQYAVRVLKAGASGYLTKDADPEEMLKAIRVAAQGRKYVTPTLAEQLANGVSLDSDKPPHEALSDREYQVMRMIAGGKTVTEIAEELALSVKTVSSYRTRLLAKLQLKNNAELTHYVLSRNLIE